MRRLKVVTVVGTRPEIIRLSRVISKLDSSESIDHTLVHTGQNYDYELNGVFFKDLELRKPDIFLEAAGSNYAETIGNTITKVDSCLQDLNPDAFLILGDTNSCLAAIAAKRRKVPVFHMEAGNRCFDQRVPEEINRKIVDHISDINLPYSSIAREYLINEGIAADRIIKTGSPMFEVLNYYSDKIESSNVIQELNLESNKYFLISAHREENIDSPKLFKNLIYILNHLAEEYGYPVVVTTHPRTRQKIDQEKVTLREQVHLKKPFGFVDYIKLQKMASAVLSDSGTINEESNILNFPALNIRESFERPEAMEEGAVILTGLNPERVFQSLQQVLNDQSHSNGNRRFSLTKDYSQPNVSDKVVRIIMSYTDLVNRQVWGK